MPLIRNIKITEGVYWVSIEKANLHLLCGCPADAVKLLKKRGLIERTEKNGFSFETGPNAILLSETLMQHGSFANLTEFPVMQMLYLQGMMIPNHPNNNGTKPLLIGTKEQLEAQMNYIYRGNYGLTLDEMLATGLPKEQAEEIMRVKLKFAFGNIQSSDVFLDKCEIEQQKTELRNGVSLLRTNPNEYNICFEGETVSINLNLEDDKQYEAPYQLGYHYVPREYFSIVHSGEGDGWDINRPCMASVLCFQGKIYLIDAGPNILATLNYLGISVNEIEGIFHTHAHDDHFAGLTTLIRTDRRFKYYASKIVRCSVAKKLAALMGMEEKYFFNFFEVHDLPLDEWKNIEGLEVKAAYSPHPIETNIFFFRAQWNGEYKTYAHLADTISFEQLEKMTGDDGISPATAQKVKENYLTPVALKKIDVGAGMIHGKAENYISDRSNKVVLAHLARPLTLAERNIGSSAGFGMNDVLIASNHNYLIDFARKYLKFYFPNAPDYELEYLVNHPIETYNAGSVLLKKDEEIQDIFLLLTGSITCINASSNRPNAFLAGSLIGSLSGYLGFAAQETYWANCNLYALKLPSKAYYEFVNRNNLYKEIKALENKILFLQQCSLFGETVSFPILVQIAYTIREWNDTASSDEHICLITEGHITINTQAGEKQHILSVGDFFGCENHIFAENPIKSLILSGAKYWAIPFGALKEIPIVHWKILETYEKRFLKV